MNRQVVSIAVQKEMKSSDFPFLPVVLKIDDVEHRIGFINEARLGRDDVFGDIRFELSGELEFEVVKDDKNKPSSIKPVKFVFQRENPSA